MGSARDGNWLQNANAELKTSSSRPKAKFLQREVTGLEHANPEVKTSLSSNRQEVKLLQEKAIALEHANAEDKTSLSSSVDGHDSIDKLLASMLRVSGQSPKLEGLAAITGRICPHQTTKMLVFIF